MNKSLKIFQPFPTLLLSCKEFHGMQKFDEYPDCFFIKSFYGRRSRGKIGREIFDEEISEQCHRSRYENYTSEPQQYLPPVFEFLGESREPGVLKFYVQHHDFGFQDSHIASTKTFMVRIGSYKKWDQKELSDSMYYAATTLEKLRYEVGG